MKMIKRFLLTVLMCGFVGVSFVHADEAADAKAPMMSPKERSSELMKELNLTDDQKKQLEADKQNQRAEIKVLFNQMMELNQQLNTELMNSKLDMNKINDINAQLKTVQEKIADKRINTILDIRKILSPEQFTKFVEMTEKMRTKRRMEHGNKEGGMMP